MGIGSNTNQDDNGLNALLADYAAGRLSAPLHGLVAGHLVMKSENRAFVATLEAMKAASLELQDNVPLSDRNKVLERILSAVEHVPVAGQSPSHALIPPPVAAFIGDDWPNLKWHTVMPGLKEVRLPCEAGTDASLLWIKAGRVMPAHTHDGTEVTLVLQGGFSDGNGHYCRGDIAIADSDVEHRPRADEGDDCVCFVVNDAPLRLTGPIARFIHRIRGH